MGISICSTCAHVLLFLMLAQSGSSKEHDGHEYQVSPWMREGPHCVYASEFGNDNPRRKVGSIGRLHVNKNLTGLVDDDDDAESPEDRHFRRQVQIARRKPEGMDPRGPDEVVEEDENGTLMTRCLAKEKCYVIWEAIFDPTTNGTFNKVVVSGCWGRDMMDGFTTSCNESRCIDDDEHLPRKDDWRFCCCSGDLCNAVFEESYVELLASAAEVEHKGNSVHHPTSTPTMMGVTCLLLALPYRETRA